MFEKGRKKYMGKVDLYILSFFYKDSNLWRVVYRKSKE